MSAPHSATPAVPSLPAACNALRARGLRVSSARRLVLAALYAADGPLSADDIAGGLGGRLPASDLASVYRNLDTLEGAGLVHHLHLGRSPGRWALAGAAPSGYVACERCGEHAVLDAAAVEGIRAAVRAASGFEARPRHHAVVGTCPACTSGRDPGALRR